MSKSFNWKKEIKSWLIMIGLFAILYATGWHTPIIGKIQSWFLATKIISPNIEQQAGPEFIFDGMVADVSGKNLLLNDLRDKTIFINYWATWCPPCLAEMPHIEDLYIKLEDNPNIVFLMIAKDQDFAKSKKFMEKKSYSLPIYKELRSSKQLKTNILPTTYVIKNGRLAFQKEGMSNFNTTKFIEFLQSE